MCVWGEGGKTVVFHFFFLKGENQPSCSGGYDPGQMGQMMKQCENRQEGWCLGPRGEVAAIEWDITQGRQALSLAHGLPISDRASEALC